jgi:hypothetical protein
MAAQARVSAVDALELFRTQLVQYSTRSHQCIDEVGDEIRRVRAWIQHDRRSHWEAELRRRRRDLDQAEQELLTAKLSSLRDSYTLQKNAVLRARRALAEAEEKIRAIKVWSRDFDNRVAPLLKQMEGLRQHLDIDLPKAIAFLLKAQDTLESYAALRPPALPTDADSMRLNAAPETPQDPAPEPTPPPTPSA